MVIDFDQMLNPVNEWRGNEKNEIKEEEKEMKVRTLSNGLGWRSLWDWWWEVRFWYFGLNAIDFVYKFWLWIFILFFVKLCCVFEFIISTFNQFYFYALFTN